MATLQAFLKEKYVKITKANTPDITHKRIKDEANHIGGGTYIIKGEDLATFYELVYNEAVIAGNIWTLTERQSGDDRILIDLDFKYAHGTARGWTMEDAEDIVCGYMEELKALVDFKGGQKINAYIMAKDAPEHLPNGTKTKDGIHIIINLKLKRKLQIELRKRVIAKIKSTDDTSIKDVFNKLPLTNEVEDIIDESITKGGTDWQIIGSRKSATAGVYKVVQKLEYEIDPQDNEWMMVRTMINAPLPREIFNDVIVTAPKTECEYTREGQRLLDPTAEANARKNEERMQLLDTAVPEDIIKLYECLDVKKRCGAGTHQNWVEVMLATKGAIGDAGMAIFVDWSYAFGDPITRMEQHEVAELYSNADPRKLKAGSLHYWAKEDNPEKYRELFAKQYRELKKKSGEEIMDLILQSYTEFRMAQLFVALYGDVHVCQNREQRHYYNFTEELMWEKDGGVKIRIKLSEKLPPLFRAKSYQLAMELDTIDPIEDKARYDAISKRKRVCDDVADKMESTIDKDRVFKEISDLIYKPKFLDDFNRSKDELPIQPRSVINMQTLEVRPRTIKDKWTYECDATYLTQMSEEDTEWCNKYFLALFCGRADTMQTTLDIFKTSLSGRVVRHIFFLLGVKGSNGKSVLLKTLKRTFTGATDTISKKIIVQDSRQSSALNTEVEKLETCRMAMTSEFDNKEKMNVKMMKEVSGGDDISLRGMRETERTIRPTANLFAITNDMPSMKIKNPKEQSAFFKRLIIIPFNAEFENNTDTEAEILSKRSQILTYIIRQGVIREKFNITDEMQTAVQDYTEDNVADSFNDFIKARIERCEYDNTSIPGRQHTRLDQKSIIEGYNSYCQQLGTHPEKMTPTKWHREIMGKFGLGTTETNEGGGKRYYHGMKWMDELDNDDGL